MARLKVLICGATGFIGRNLCERLAVRDDLEVTGVWNKIDPSAPLTNLSRLRLVRADLTQRDQVEAVLQGQDVLIQAAAVTTGAKDTVTRPYIHVTDNAVMNALLFRACFEQHVKHVVFFSCTAVYAPQAEPVREEDFNFQLNEKYFGAGWTKVYNEKICEFYSRLGRTKHTVIRHSNIYGPYDKFDLERSHVFGATVAKVMTAQDGKITVWGDGSETRDVLYVSDLMDFVEQALARQVTPFELVNVGYGESIAIRDLVARIIKHSGRDLRMEFDLSKPTIPFHLTLNLDRARTRFGWQPKVSLDEGVQKTLAWHRENVFTRSGK